MPYEQILHVVAGGERGGGAGFSARGQLQLLLQPLRVASNLKISAKRYLDRGLIRSYTLLRNTNKYTIWLQAANEAVGQGSAPADNFKFFLNPCEWLVNYKCCQNFILTGGLFALEQY